MMMDAAIETEEVIEKPPVSVPVVRVPVKHTNLGIRSHAMDMSTMVELTSFSSLGKIQPFLVTLSTTAALIVDLHCHLKDKEVCGYLGGHWDINAHNLTINYAFPCRCNGKDKTAAAATEAEIARAMEWKHLTLVGWYHSHPRTHASPSLRDVDSQLDYQIKMKGLSDNSYTPCVGLICSPYNTDNNCYESNFNFFWSLPPPENRPHEYPRPMLLSYTLSQEQFLSQEAIDEIKKCVEYYKNDGCVDFKGIFNGSVTYLEKLKSSLESKLPRNQSNGSYWDAIREIVAPGMEDPPTTTQASSIAGNSDIFSNVKFPLVPDPMGRSGINPNNLFLTPVNFKLDSSVSILKPFNVPSTSKDKNDTLEATKGQKFDLPMPDMNLNAKHKLPAEFTSGELTVSVKNSKPDYDFSTADFSKVSNLLSSDSSSHGAGKNRIPEFPLADISQLSKFSDLSKLANFSTSDLAKLSGFSINDIAKTSPAYACNLANLFNPLGGKAQDVTVIDVNKTTEFPISEFISSDISFKPSDVVKGLVAMSTVDTKLTVSELPVGEQKKNPDSGDSSKSTRNDYSMDDVSIANVKSDFGTMLDVTVHGMKQQSGGNDCPDSLNLSIDHQSGK
ncbi:uncharacterized protein [Neodiprion pinetum]|uniref:uncharacterized protein n=1 Tax=Neodiprion pinetum TaxID=441929 RepID=UPI001EDE7731|nr:uncharacterized protein LOC124219452 [Neodiprion pinetum]XP_046482979.1 uncharacterized protein LOC124219452 [Neodiprion pinetum]XP_046482980.1 uncharacterized protein LOC124219452 [Neodiprion pinetum]XP_046482982.1 uncharacterized protein LOC124219452 [Neodiprion pinetum]XP_046482983.1 uncharacterized protein LOC124219452 [Neodiprion pinetum]